ncbi:hypothetical protein EDC01DRAFT_621326 [Geopyxis carbonaria]|nr:hypothetical protein EDC01DRAFT_621326 [Geopyxis carbonaria]
MADKHASGSLAIQDLFNVKGFRCVVTGGGTGIGLMIAQGLAKNGATVYITGRRKEALDTVVKAYSGKSEGDGKIIGIPCDITKKDQLSALVQQITSAEPQGINLLVNNAGVAPEDSTRGKGPEDMKDEAAVHKWLWNSDPAEWATTLEVNVTAQYFTAVAFLPLLCTGSRNLKGHAPTIINITSVSGVLKSSTMGQFAYSSSKAGAIHLTRQLASAMAGLRVRVNSIAPGLFPSEMTAREPAEKGTGKSYLPQGERSWPARRAGDEGDIVAAVVWLASAGGVFHNGHTVYLDGGLTLTSPSAA